MKREARNRGIRMMSQARLSVSFYAGSAASYFDALRYYFYDRFLFRPICGNCP